MIKVTHIFKDGSKLVYTIQNKKSYLVPKYANEYINSARIKSITVQKYPLKNNEPIDWLNNRPDIWEA